ncbi:MAG TPA: hypothetical protein VFH17_00825 [Coriobacteriia bacterium]|nr:hypothetical protein [Coriobacteriia bacterium]
MVGVGLLLASRASFRAFTPESVETGLALVAVSLFVRMVLAAGALLAYHRLVPDGFAPFAVALASGFLVMYAVELVRYGKVFARPR